MRGDLRRDAVVTLLARAVPGILTIMAIPVYVRILGPEMYVAIGIFITLQMLIGVLDLGVSSALLREVSWLTGHNAPTSSLLALLKTTEAVFMAAAILIGSCGILFGEVIIFLVFGLDTNSVGLDHLSAFLIFLAIASRFPFNGYYAFICGRGEVAKANYILLVADSVRVIGSIVLLLLLGPILTLFFLWNALTVIGMTLIGRRIAYGNTMQSNGSARFDLKLIRKLQGFALSASVLSLLFITVNSIDKLLLPRFLSSTEFGYYIAISQLASIVFMAAHPLWVAIHPRILMAVSGKDYDQGRRLFSIASTLIVAICMGALVGSSIGGGVFIRYWIGTDIDISTYSIVLGVLITGFSFAALAHLSLTLQHARKNLNESIIILLLSVIIILTCGLLFAESINVTPIMGSVVWSFMYLMFFLSGAIILFRFARMFLALWIKNIVIPVTIALAVSMYLYAGEQQLPSSLLLFLSALAAVGVALLCVGFNRDLRLLLIRYLVKE